MLDRKDCFGQDLSLMPDGQTNLEFYHQGCLPELDGLHNVQPDGHYITYNS